MSEAFEGIAAGIFSLTWGDDSLIRSLREGDERVRAKIKAVMEYKAPQVENYMKINAPWTDQTGNARQGLRAQPFEEGSNLGIILFHQVPYGIWLELKNSGEYAIIEPTVASQGPEVMKSIERILESI